MTTWGFGKVSYSLGMQLSGTGYVNIVRHHVELGRDSESSRTSS